MGTIAELQGKPDRLYPLLWLSNEGGSLEDNYKVDNIRLTMFGRVIAGEEGQDDDASEIEVLSDMQLILLDFLNYFHQQHGQEYVTDKAATLEHFTERTNDRTAGYSVVLELKQFYDWNKCQIPESGASIPPSVDGLTLYDFCDQSVLDRLTAEQNACLASEFGGAVVTEQINGVTIGTVSAGSTNDTVIENSASTPIGTAANPSVIADSQAQVNGVNTETIAATVTHNQSVHDSAGADVGTAANPSVVSDATVRNNATPTWSDTVEAEGTLTLSQAKALDSDGSTTLLADYIPTADGFMFTCTPGAALPSLAVALDESSIEFGSTLTVTCTPSDITPTNYYGWSECAGGSLTKIGSQAGNVFVWAVSSVEGSSTVYVVANDGSASAFNIGGEAYTVTTIYMNNAFGGALGMWSPTLRNESFADPLVRVRRSSDSDEADFTGITESPERLNAASTASNSSPASHDGDTFATFISTDNGFITDKYDQVGSVDFTQGTTSAQSKIATSGTINTENGYPLSTFDGNDNEIGWNNTTAPASYQGLSDAITYIAVINPSAVINTSGSAWSPNYTICELRVNSSSSTCKVPFSFGIDASRLFFGCTDNYTTNAETVSSQRTLNAGERYVVAFVVDGDDVSLYINGLLDSTTTLTTATGNRSVTTSNSSFIRGSRTRDGGQADNAYFLGDIGTDAIYDSALTTDQVQKLTNYYLT